MAKAYNAPGELQNKLLILVNAAGMLSKTYWRVTGYSSGANTVTLKNGHSTRSHVASFREINDSIEAGEIHVQ